MIAFFFLADNNFTLIFRAERLRNATESQLVKAHKELSLVKDDKQKLEQVKEKLTTQLRETKQQVSKLISFYKNYD